MTRYHPKPQVIDLDYHPRPLQQHLHDNIRRFSCIVCHRGFGKTVLSVNQLINGAIAASHDMPRFQYIAPLLKQAKDISWGYLKQYALKVPGTTTNESELYVQFPNGGRVTIYGADNPDALRGLYFDGVVLDEYAKMDPRMWTEIILPRIDDHNGWALFIGTPQGINNFYEIFEGAKSKPDWFAAMYRASETGIYTPQQLAMRKAEMNNDDLYEQEMECSFLAALVGSYYGRLMNAAEGEGRITEIPISTALPVITAWDIGYGDSTGIWFAQRDGFKIKIIDYYENNHKGLDHYVKMIREKPYVYEAHVWPHDGAHGEWLTGGTRIEAARKLGIFPKVLERYQREDGIQAVRDLIPQCHFDRKRCADGLKALRQYQKEWNGKRQCFEDRPLHDWSADAADAFRYLAHGLNVIAPQSLKKLDYKRLDRLYI